MSELTTTPEQAIRARLNRCYEAAARNDPPAYAEAWMDMDANAKPDIEDLLAEVDRLRGKLADAWDEGYEAGEANENHVYWNAEGTGVTNPYRKEDQ